MPQSFQKDGNQGCRYSLCDPVRYEELGKGGEEQGKGIGNKYSVVHFTQTTARSLAVLSSQGNTTYIRHANISFIYLYTLFYGNVSDFTLAMQQNSNRGLLFNDPIEISVLGCGNYE